MTADEPLAGFPALDYEPEPSPGAPMSETTAAPSISVSDEARQSLLDYLARSGPAQYIRVHVGHG